MRVLAIIDCLGGRSGSFCISPARIALIASGTKCGCLVVCSSSMRGLMVDGRRLWAVEDSLSENLRLIPVVHSHTAVDFAATRDRTKEEHEGEMASRRKTRSDMPPNPAAIVRALRTLRDAMTEASRHLTIGGPVYLAAHGVMKAIYALAFLLTGERDYFSSVGGGATDAYREKMADRAARERGEKPWS